MILVLIAVFGFSVVGMLAIPLRHIPRARNLEEEIDVAASSVVRVRVASAVKRVETWFEHFAKNEFLKFTDYVLKFFEHGAGRVAGSTKNLRLKVQERFRVIPRESLYWRHIRTWKKENGSVPRPMLWEDENDISNHIER